MVLIYIFYITYTLLQSLIMSSRAFYSFIHLINILLSLLIVSKCLNVLWFDFLHVLLPCAFCYPLTILLLQQPNLPTGIFKVSSNLIEFFIQNV